MQFEESSTGAPDGDERVHPGDPYWNDGAGLPPGPDLVEHGYDRQLPGLTAEPPVNMRTMPSPWWLAYLGAYLCAGLGVASMVGWTGFGGFIGFGLFCGGWLGLYLIQVAQRAAHDRVRRPLRPHDEEPGTGWTIH